MFEENGVNKSNDNLNGDARGMGNSQNENVNQNETVNNKANDNFENSNSNNNGYQRRTINNQGYSNQRNYNQVNNGYYSGQNAKNNYVNPNNYSYNYDDKRNINASYKVEDENKKSNGAAKVLGLTAAGLIIALSGGIVGGVVTNRMVKTGQQVQTTVESASYAAPEFLSSTDGSLTVSEAFEKVAPAVVTISTKGYQQSGYGNFQQEVEGIGSGFIINEDGYILTNYHVIKGSTEVKVLLSTGEEVAAKVINYDQERDMAVIKLADNTKVPGVAELGDSSALYPGEDVIAIGTPLSTEFAQTCTKGIVSAVGRKVTTDSGAEMSVIQTDTAINPGNSGGPLINTKGQVVGINSMKLVEDTVEGIGFSIPINDAKERIEALSKPILSLGITISEVTEEVSKKSNYPQGLFVKGVEQNSAAETSGISIGDVIIEFDGKQIKTADDLTKAKEEKKAGDKVDIVVCRNGKNIKLQLELTEG